ncbi:hypothetical protein EPUS_03758 [Endocarpon pusillum Z07020]|uniref:Uncharacterized protein n=1 Tax=Endocarpon pusillum (strain Z07020 / HMAS-L-300199) TaxID=1263415 RepID=U1HEF3_ENDPU|nr:uncharacterized protein EPUS_03758 [Endocarpon pusillum Z07020]ERF68440.1 hypothetical protein EPUS_03758 [Endocarpon pusillum Z07020]
MEPPLLPLRPRACTQRSSEVSYQAHGHASSVKQAYRLEYRSKSRLKAPTAESGGKDRWDGREEGLRKVKLVLNEIILKAKVIESAESVLICGIA